jgi:hypothetical protein
MPTPVSDRSGAVQHEIRQPGGNREGNRARRGVFPLPRTLADESHNEEGNSWTHSEVASTSSSAASYRTRASGGALRRPHPFANVGAVVSVGTVA